MRTRLPRCGPGINTVPLLKVRALIRLRDGGSPRAQPQADITVTDEQRITMHLGAAVSPVDAPSLPPSPLVPAMAHALQALCLALGNACLPAKISGAHWRSQFVAIVAAAVEMDSSRPAQAPKTSSNAQQKPRRSAWRWPWGAVRITSCPGCFSGETRGTATFIHTRDITRSVKPGAAGFARERAGWMGRGHGEWRLSRLDDCSSRPVPTHPRILCSSVPFPQRRP